MGRIVIFYGIFDNVKKNCRSGKEVHPFRPQFAELSRSDFDPELFSYSAYVNFFVTFATKVLYLTFCDKMRQFLIWKWIEREEVKIK